MAFPNFGNQSSNLKVRYLYSATTTASGTPTAFTPIPARCKYIGTYYLPNNAGTGANVEGYDVLAVLNASLSVPATTLTNVSSGIVVTTSTGTFASYGAAQTNVFLNAGDILVTAGSTLQGGFVTHVVQEF